MKETAIVITSILALATVIIELINKSSDLKSKKGKGKSHAQDNTQIITNQFQPSKRERQFRGLLLISRAIFAGMMFSIFIYFALFVPPSEITTRELFFGFAVLLVAIYSND